MDERNHATGTVLVVGDEGTLDAVRSAFETCGREARFDHVSTVVDALDRLAADTYACVLVAGRLGDAEGVELVRRVRERDADVPLVSFPVDSDVDDERVADAIDAGATDVVVRGDPGAPRRLGNTVERALQNRAAGTPFDPGDLQRYRALAEHFPRGSVFLFDEELRYLLAAGSGLREVGPPPASVEGRTLQAVFEPETVERLEPAYRDALDGRGSTIDVPYEGRIYCVDTVPITDEEGTTVAGMAVTRDVTERRERERAMATHERAVNAAGDGIYQIDEDGRFQMVNDTLVRLTGYDRSTLLGEHVSIIMDEADVRTGRRHVRGLLERDWNAVSFEMEIYPREGEPIPVENRIVVQTDAEGRLLASLGILRDVTERREHERTLTALHDTTRDLLRAETDAEIADRVVEAAETTLSFDCVGIFRFDETTNRLEPLACSEQTREVIGEPPTIGPGEGVAWEAFVSGDAHVYDDVREASTVYNDETPLRSEVLLPLGEFGVLISGNTTVGPVDERTVEMLETLAANCEAALGRARREVALRDRDRKLQVQNGRLERLEEINRKIRRINHGLVGAESRREIERIVCRQLAGEGRYEFAWIGRVDPVEDALVPRHWYGGGGDYLDRIDTELNGEVSEPAVVAARTRESVVVDAIADGLREDEWRREALTRDFLSAAAVPLVYDGAPYGVLAVYADRSVAFDEETRAVLSELGETVGYAINAVERRQALLSETRVEIEFALEDGPSPLFSLASAVGGRVELESVVPGAEGTSLLYVTVQDPDVEDLDGAASQPVAVESVRRLDGPGDRVRLELRVVGDVIPRTVADHGAVLEDLSVAAGEGQVVVSMSESGDVREFVDRFTEKYPSATLLTKRRRPGGPTAGSSPEDLLQSLTPRQLETLRAAHHSGFFRWPRESTGEEVADSLGVSQPTFLEHLRRAEAKLVDRLLDDERRATPADD